MDLQDLKKTWQTNLRVVTETKSPDELYAALSQQTDNALGRIQKKHRRVLFFLIGACASSAVIFLLASDGLRDSGSTQGFIKLLAMQCTTLVFAWFLYANHRFVAFSDNLKRRLKYSIRRLNQTRRFTIAFLLLLYPTAFFVSQFGFGNGWDGITQGMGLVSAVAGVGLVILQAYMVQKQYRIYIRQLSLCLEEYNALSGEANIPATAENPRLISYTWKDAVAILILFVAIYGLVNVLAMGFVKYTIGFEKFFEGKPEMPLSVHLVNHMGKALGLVGSVYFIKIMRQKYTWEVMGFRPIPRKWIMYCVGIGVGMPFILLSVAKLVGTLLPAWKQMAKGVFLDNQYNLAENLILLVIICVIVPVSEELFYRGFLYHWFRNRRPLWVAILVSSVVFGISHIIPLQVVNATVGGVMLAWVFEKTRSLWATILIHSLNNLMGALIAFAYNYHWLE